MNYLKRIVSIFLCLVCFAGYLSAAESDLDPSFVTGNGNTALGICFSRTAKSILSVSSEM